MVNCSNAGCASGKATDTNASLLSAHLRRRRRHVEDWEAPSEAMSKASNASRFPDALSLSGPCRRAEMEAPGLLLAFGDVVKRGGGLCGIRTVGVPAEVGGRVSMPVPPAVSLAASQLKTYATV